MKTFEPGALIHLVEIQQQEVTAQDDHGQPIRTWQCKERCAARVEELDGRDGEIARQLYHLARVRVTMWWSPFMNNSARLLWNNRILDIGHIVNPDGRQQYQVALCGEGAGNGS